MRQTHLFDDKTDVLVFLRVPKTGSTSVASALTDALGKTESAILPDRHVDGLDCGLARAHDQFRRLSMRVVDSVASRAKGLLGCADQIKKARFLHGHHPLWASIRTNRRPCFITSMRDPIDRFLSLYFFYRLKAEMTLDTVGSEKRQILLRDPSDYVQWVLSTPVRRRLNSHCLYLTRSGNFQDAKEALQQKIHMAAVLEDLDLLMNSLQNYLGRRVPKLQHLNAGRIRPRDNPLSAEVESRLREALTPDYRLFDFLSRNKRKFLA